MKSRIITERISNPFYRYYHTTVEISESRQQSFERPLRDSSEKHLEEVGKHGREIVETLLRLDGVTNVALHPYKVGVSIGEAYEWEDVHPHILATLKKVFADKCHVSEEDVEVTEKYQAPKWSGGFGSDPNFNSLSFDLGHDEEPSKISETKEE